MTHTSSAAVEASSPHRVRGQLQHLTYCGPGLRSTSRPWMASVRKQPSIICIVQSRGQQYVELHGSALESGLLCSARLRSADLCEAAEARRHLFAVVRMNLLPADVSSTSRTAREGMVAFMQARLHDVWDDVVPNVRLSAAGLYAVLRYSDPCNSLCLRAAAAVRANQAKDARVSQGPRSADTRCLTRSRSSNTWSQAALE